MFSGEQLKAPESLHQVPVEVQARHRGSPARGPAPWTSAVLSAEPLPSGTQRDPAWA